MSDDEIRYAHFVAVECAQCHDKIDGAQNGLILLTVLGAVTGSRTIHLCGPSCLLSFVSDASFDMAAKGVWED
jgi:hypothetical protein